MSPTGTGACLLSPGGPMHLELSYKILIKGLIQEEAWVHLVLSSLSGLTYTPRGRGLVFGEPVSQEGEGILLKLR